MVFQLVPKKIKLSQIKSADETVSITLENGKVTINGNLDVVGDVTYVHTSDLYVRDNKIVLNAGETGEGVSLGEAGISIDRGTLSNAQIIWDENTDSFKFQLESGAKVPIECSTVNADTVNSTNVNASNVTTDNLTVNTSVNTNTLNANSISSQSVATNELKDAGQGYITLKSNLIPDSDNTYDLGSSTLRWRNIYGVAIFGEKIGVKITTPEDGIHVLANPNYGITIESIGDHPRLTLKGKDPNGIKHSLILQGGYWGQALEILFPSPGYYVAISPVHNADSTNTVINPAELFWKAKYWDSTNNKSVDYFFEIIPELLNNAPTARLRFRMGGKDYITIHSTNGIIVNDRLVPASDNTLDLGSSTMRWKSIHAVNVSTSNLDSSNISTNTLTVNSSATITGLKLGSDLNANGYNINNVNNISAKKIFTSRGAQLGLQDNGGGVLILANNPNDNAIYLEGFSSDLQSSASFIAITGRYASNLPELRLYANVTKFRGNAIPTSDNRYDLGSQTLRWRTLYAVNVNASTTKTDNLTDNGAGKITLSSHIIPAADNTYDLGAPDKMFRAIYTYKLTVAEQIQPSTDIIPTADATYNLGSATNRWKAVYTVDLYTGDIKLMNNWVITERDENGQIIKNGVRILNDKGEEIFRITEDGIYFKGKKIKLVFEE